MSLTSYIGTERNILDETPQHCHTLKLPQPILTNRDLEKLRRVSQGDFLATTLPMLFPVEDGGKGLERALKQLCRRASLAIQSGYTLLILSDRGVDEDYAPIPSLLALTAVHNHLVREETRTQVALIIESGEPREVMHFALLIGYGASAINPYLALETVRHPTRRKPRQLHQGHQQGPAQDLLEDGHLHPAELSRRAGLRSHRPQQATGRPVLHRHRLAHRGRRPRRPRRGSHAQAPLRLPPGHRLRDRAGRRRQLPIPRARRVSPLQSADHRQAAARRAAGKLPDVPGIHGPDRQPEPPALHAARRCSSSRTRPSPCRSKRWSRPRKSSSASPPAPCRSAPFRRKRTRRSPSP